MIAQSGSVPEIVAGSESAPEDLRDKDPGVKKLIGLETAGEKLASLAGHATAKDSVVQAETSNVPTNNKTKRKAVVQEETSKKIIGK